MQRLCAASCLLFALLSSATLRLPAEKLKVRVIETHTGVRLGSVERDTEPAWTRCDESSGQYSREFGFHCANAEAMRPASDYEFFYDLRVIMPDAAQLVFHCSTIMSAKCGGFPEYPKNTSVVCRDFVFLGRAYKDCTASGSAPQPLGVYTATVHGDRMTIFGAHWRRNYLHHGTWQMENAAARKPAAVEDARLAAAQQVNQAPGAARDPEPAASQDPKPVAAQDPKPPASQDPKPDAAQDPKPTAPQDPKPAAPQEDKPATAPDTSSTPATAAAAESKSADTPPVALIAPAAEPALDPRTIEQAKAGDPVAQYKLGYDYFLGRGVPLDYVQAAIWWRKAADQGYPEAQNNLGVLYNSGKGVPQSYADAYFWQNLAASRASGPLQGQFAKNRDESASKLWLLSRLKVQQRAAKWAADHPVPARAHEPPQEKRGEYP